jgi:hypothetical protein
LVLAEFFIPVYGATNSAPVFSQQSFTYTAVYSTAASKWTVKASVNHSTEDHSTVKPAVTIGFIISMNAASINDNYSQPHAGLKHT